MTSTETFHGCLVGTAVGDALGLPAEKQSAARIRRRWRGEWRMRLVFGCGMFSDDTEHSYAVAQALAEQPDDAAAFQRALAEIAIADYTEPSLFWERMHPCAAGNAPLALVDLVLLPFPRGCESNPGWKPGPHSLGWPGERPIPRFPLLSHSGGRRCRAVALATALQESRVEGRGAGHTRDQRHARRFWA